jgi:hypothetical protein
VFVRVGYVEVREVGGRLRVGPFLNHRNGCFLIGPILANGSLCDRKKDRKETTTVHNR